MAKLILPGGTDVAEVALFSVDALPAQLPEPAGLAALEAERLLVRFPTGADGGYLLHVYLDEPVPDELMRYCSDEDVKRGRLRLPDGRLGFGGTESVCADFAPNEAIRSDGAAPPGEYQVTAYRTKFPDDLIAHAIATSLDNQAKKHLAIPVQIVLGATTVTVTAIVFKLWLVPVVVALAAAAALRLYLKHPTTKQLREHRRTLELRYPSIVVAMRSVDSPAPALRGGASFEPPPA